MVKTYTKKQFIEDVKKEARALREHATKEEISALNFENLNPRMASKCIYGQMTGSCFSERAADLIHRCCKKYFKNKDEEGDMTLEEHSYEGDVREFVNGAKLEGVSNAADMYKHRHEDYFHFSSIEAYIMDRDAKPQNLIQYLKGERNDLVL